MAETTVAPQSDTSTDAKTDVKLEDKKVPGNIVSRGPVTPATFTTGTNNAAFAATNINGEEGKAAAADIKETAEEKTAREAKETLLKNETPEQKTARELAEKNKPPELTDEQFKELLKGRGIELDDKGIDGLKEKLKPAAAAKAPEDVEKEKVAAEAAFEKRMLDHFIANGGTPENFVALKQVAAADLKALSASEIHREMKEAKFTDEEIATVLKERYYQINPEELVQGDDETTEDFEKRKVLTEKKIAFGAKKLESKSSHIKKQAEDALSTLREVIKTQDLMAAEEVKHSERVEDFFKKAERKVKLELGKVKDKDGKESPSIEFDFPIPEEIITDVMGTLKDPAKRKQFLYNEDNSLNLDNVSKVLLENSYLKAALKDVFSEGGTRQVEAFEKMFPGRAAKDIGVGGATGGDQNKRKGVIVSRGAPEPVRRN